jgi:hypothetical protein
LASAAACAKALPLMNSVVTRDSRPSIFFFMCDSP